MKHIKEVLKQYMSKEQKQFTLRNIRRQKKSCSNKTDKNNISFSSLKVFAFYANLK